MNSPYDNDRSGKGTEAASKREETKSALRLAPAPTSQPADFSNEILRKLTYEIGKDPIVARNHDWLAATILAVRDRVIDHWMASTRDTYHSERKRVYYLSLEFLIGRLLRDAMSNLGPDGHRSRGAAASSASISTSSPSSSPMRRSAMAAWAGSPPASWRAWRRVGIPAYGYGIRYDHGLFRQKIIDGAQVELPEDWLAHGNPWEFERRECAYEIGFGGTVEASIEADGSAKYVWRPAETRAGRRLRHADRRLARARGSIRCGCGAPGPSIRSGSTPSTAATMSARSPNGRGPRAITRVLYPSDATPAGQELRLRQEYFFTSASLQDLLRRHVQQFGDVAQPRRQGGDPAQRHPSGDRRGRADAPADDDHRASPGTRPGRSPAQPSPTPITRCCRRRWRAGRSICSSGCCRATCRSSMPSTQR